MKKIVMEKPIDFEAFNKFVETCNGSIEDKTLKQVFHIQPEQGAAFLASIIPSKG